MQFYITKLKTMKTLKLLFITCVISSVAFAQAPGKKNVASIQIDSTYYPDTSLRSDNPQFAQKMKQVQLLTKDHYYLGHGSIGIKFKSISTTANAVYAGAWRNDAYRSILIEGDCSIEVAALEITEKNADEYKFRVLQDDQKVLVPWAKPTIFKHTADGQARYAYLGLYPSNAPKDRELKIELYKNNVRIDAIVIGWGMIEPALVSGFILHTQKNRPSHSLLGREFNSLKETVRHVGGKIVNNKWVETTEPFTDFIETTTPDDIKFHAEDSLQLIEFFIRSRSKLYSYKVVLQRDIDGKKDSVNLGETNRDLALYKEFWKQPGKYNLLFIPIAHTHGGQSTTLFNTKATNVSFTVLPPVNKESYFPLWAFVFYAIGVGSVSLRILFYFRRRQKNEKIKRQIAVQQLQGVRSQLNPHFIFNALAGIQNLMNKNEVENANKYLARFARLTRNVLDDGQQEMIPIEQEVSVLTDYLEMEQMRFGFRFAINVGEGVDRQIEIPAMLLQPFVENAVKHGISALKGEGLITVNINQTKNDISLKVTDNGGGFSKTPSPGMGIKLCEARIKLLNSIYKNTTILLHTNSTDKGVVVTIELKNWL
jgi:two-component system, LytTR family, sensor kinase